MRRVVLVTGAGGNIGSFFAERVHERFDLRLTDRDEEALEAVAGLGETRVADVGDLEAMKALCEGVDTVVHLAATPDPGATWSEVLDLNIVGTYHTMVAARAAGCRRVVYASSIHAVSGYEPARQVRVDDPVRPGDLYGVSKSFGEALGCYLADQEGLSVIAVRIGAFQPVDVAHDADNAPMLDLFVSRRDLAQLLERCVEVDDVGFAIVHGLSGNRFNRLDLSDTIALTGYRPRDDFAAESPAVADEALEVRAGDQSEGTGSGIREEL